MNPMNLARGVGALCVVVACGLLLGESNVSAQGNVTSVCVSASTGAVRVVSDGSGCRPNELPLQWNVAGENKIVALATTVFGSTKSVTIPQLGVLEVRCDAAGVPTISLQLAGGAWIRIDEFVAAGDVDTSVLVDDGPTNRTFTTTDPVFGRVRQAWIHLLGIDAQWKLDTFVRSFGVVGPSLTKAPCTAAASITVMQ